MGTHIFQNVQVTSNKMAPKKRQHFLALFFMPLAQFYGKIEPASKCDSFVRNVFYFFRFLKVFVDKNGIKSATPLKIWGFEEKMSGILVFSLEFCIWERKSSQRLNPFLEFFA